MTDTPRETRVLDAVVSLVDSLLDDFHVVELLTDLTARLHRAARRRGGAAAAGRPAPAPASDGGDLRAVPRTGAVLTERSTRRRMHRRHRDPIGFGTEKAQLRRTLAIREVIGQAPAS